MSWENLSYEIEREMSSLIYNPSDDIATEYVLFLERLELQRERNLVRPFLESVPHHHARNWWRRLLKANRRAAIRTSKAKRQESQPVKTKVERKPSKKYKPRNPPTPTRYQLKYKADMAAMTEVKKRVRALRERMRKLDRIASEARENGQLLPEKVATDMGNVLTELHLAERELKGGK